MNRVMALARADLRATSRDGEQLLLGVGLPLLFLVLFSTVDLLPTGEGESIDFLAPGILALAVMSTAFVRLAIALGFDRSFGAIRRFAATPLRPIEFLAAKGVTTLVLILGQLVLIGGVALALGWSPAWHVAVVPSVLLGLVTFVVLAFALTGFVDGLASLAVANALYVVLLLLSGLVFDRAALPGVLETVTSWLPGTQLVELVRATTSQGSAGPAWAWIGLVSWAVGGMLVALRRFRWA